MYDGSGALAPRKRMALSEKLDLCVPSTRSLVASSHQSRYIFSCDVRPERFGEAFGCQALPGVRIGYLSSVFAHSSAHELSLTRMHARHPLLALVSAPAT